MLLYLCGPSLSSTNYCQYNFHLTESFHYFHFIIHTRFSSQRGLELLKSINVWFMTAASDIVLWENPVFNRCCLNNWKFNYISNLKRTDNFLLNKPNTQNNMMCFELKYTYPAINKNKRRSRPPRGVGNEEK